MNTYIFHATIADLRAESKRLLSERVYSEAECAQLRADVARLEAEREGTSSDLSKALAEVARYKEQAAKGTEYVLAQINEDLRAETAELKERLDKTKMSASVCPLCLGQGYVIDLRASSTSATCRGCNGKGIVFQPPTDDTTDDELGLLRLLNDQRATIASLRADVARLEGANEDQYAELQQLSELRNAEVARLREALRLPVLLDAINADLDGDGLRIELSPRGRYVLMSIDAALPETKPK